MVAVDMVWILFMRSGLGVVQAAASTRWGEESQRIVDTVERRIRRQASERGDEVRMPSTREDVLKSMGSQQRLLDDVHLRRPQVSSAGPGEVVTVGSGLPLHGTT